MADIGKYQDVFITLTDWKDPLRYWVLTGEVLNSGSVSHTSVSGGGSNPDGTTQSVSSRTWTTNTIFFKCGDKERSVELTDNTVPVRPGNHISFIAAKRPSDNRDWWPYVALYNHDTNEWGLVSRGDKIKPQSGIKTILSTAAWLIPIVILPASCAKMGGHFQEMDFIFGAFFGLIPGLLAYFSVNHFFKKLMRKRIAADVRKLVDCMRSGKELKSIDDGPNTAGRK